MPTFDFTSPDGKTYSVDGPEGSTSAQAFQVLQTQLGGGAAAPDLGDNRASMLSALRGIPIAGAYADKGAAMLNAAAQPLLETGLSHAPTYDERVAENETRLKAGTDKFEHANPIGTTIGKMAIGSAAMLPAMVAAPEAFGLAGPMSLMVRNGAISGAALSGADAAARGEDIAPAATIGGVIGGAAGPVGKGVGKVVSAIADRVRPSTPIAQNVARVGNVDIPLTAAEISQDAGQSAEAQIIARGGRGDAAQAEAQGFLDNRGARVTQASNEIGAGLDPTGAASSTAPQDAAEKIAAELVAKEQARVTAAARDSADVLSSGQRMAHAMEPGGQMRGATPGDAAESLSDSLTVARDASKTNYRGKYDAVAQAPGEFAPGSAAGFRGDVENGLRSADLPVSLDPTNTPKSLLALDAIDRRMNLAGPAVPKPSAPGLGDEHARMVSDIRARFGEDVAAAYDRQTLAASKPAADLGPQNVATSPGDVTASNGTANINKGAGALDPHSVSVAGGGSVDVAPKVVEASTLKTSADPGYDPALQPRDRSRAASAGQVNDIAKNLNPERLGRSAEADRGAPIVGADSMVESGNGRVAAIRQAYKENGPAAAKYREWLQSQGADVAGMREPVLVRERTSTMTPEQRKAFTVGANQGSTLAMSAPERALADARLISGDGLASIKNPADLSSVENRDFVRQFVAKLPQTEQGAIVDAGGQLSQEGATRVRNAVLAKAYGDSPILTRIAESTHDDVKSISNALTASAPEWAAVREGVASGSIAKEMDITADMLDAVSRTARIRARGAGLADSMAQGDAFNKQSSTSEQLMRLFYDADGRRAASSSQVSQALRYYAQEAAKVEASPGLMLGLEAIKPGDILDLAALKVSAPKAIAKDVLETATKAVAAGEKMAAAAQAPGSGFTMRDVDQVRKELNSLYGDARRAMMAGGSGADLHALEHIIDQFDDRVSRMIAEGKFSGDGPAVDAMQKEARAAFADHKQKFARRGSGDTIGAAVEKILGKFSDTKATPDEVVRLSYGSGSAPGGQMPVQIAQRIAKIFGKDSSEFGAYKQGLFSHLTQGEPEAAAARIDEFLNGVKGKLLSQTVFDAPERIALSRYADKLRGIAPQPKEPGAVAAAVRRITGADGSAPASSNEVVNYLYGANGKGAGRVSVPLAVHLKQELSADGWTAVRQGMWEKLTNAGEGKIEFEAQALSQRLHEFLNESGSQLAKVLYSPQELATMQKLASVYKQMIPVRGTTNPSGTAPMLAKMAGGLRHTLLPLLGFAHGGLPGAAVALGVDKGLGAIGNIKNARNATKLFYGDQAKRPINPQFAKVTGVAAQSAQIRGRSK